MLARLQAKQADDSQPGGLSETPRWGGRARFTHRAGLRLHDMPIKVAARIGLWAHEQPIHRPSGSPQGPLNVVREPTPLAGFRTFQICPKDLPVSLLQPQIASCTAEGCMK
jgi:hypothetical protein